MLPTRCESNLRTGCLWPILSLSALGWAGVWFLWWLVKESSMEGTLVHLLILVIILGVIWYVVTLVPIPPPFKNVALVIIGAIAVIYLISLLFGYSTPLFRR